MAEEQKVTLGSILSGAKKESDSKFKYIGIKVDIDNFKALCSVLQLDPSEVGGADLFKKMLWVVLEAKAPELLPKS